MLRLFRYKRIHMLLPWVWRGEAVTTRGNKPDHRRSHVLEEGQKI